MNLVPRPHTCPQLHRRSDPRRLVLATTAVALLLTGCSGSGQEEEPVAPQPAASVAAPSASQAPPNPPLSEAQVVASGLTTPWSLVFLGQTPIVSERDTGRILELDAAGTPREVGVVDGVVHRGESGLLGLALDEQSRLYAFSTGDGVNRIQRFQLTGAAGSLAMGPPETILDDLPSAGFHNGGRLAFGPDGMLYVGTGDAGQSDLAQDVDALNGKILRLTPDGGVPNDNPFPGSPVFSLGHRNVQGLGWATDGTMFASEFGQDTWDELNIITPGSNYGWPQVEGIAGESEFTDPQQQWDPDDASPSGLAVLGDRIAIADLRGENLRVVDVATPQASRVEYAGEYGRLRDAVAGPDGTLWVLTSNTDGRGDPGADDDRILRLPVG